MQYGVSRAAIICVLAFLTGCKSPEAVPTFTKQYELNEKYVPEIDSNIYRSADSYREVLASQMNEVLVMSDQVLEKGLPESLLGNYVADVCLASGNNAAEASGIRPAEFIVLNSGGLRKSLPQGKITRGDFYEVMPFENQLVILSLSGSHVIELLDFIATKGGTPVSGITLQLDKGRKSVMKSTILGNTVEPNRIYRIMTADYLANGGDQYTVFTKASTREDVGLKIRDALIDDARAKGKKGIPLHSQLDKRISYAE